MLELPLATAKDWDTEPGSKRRNVSLLGQVCHDFNVLPPLLFNDHHIHDCGWPWFTWLLENIWWERMHRWRERCTCLLPHLADISLLLWNKLLSCLLATLAKFVVVDRITWIVQLIWWLYLQYSNGFDSHWSSRLGCRYKQLISDKKLWLPHGDDAPTKLEHTGC